MIPIAAAPLASISRLGAFGMLGVSMVQKVSEVVGLSPQSFAKAAENAVTEASKTVRGMRWARVSELEMELEGAKVKTYRASVRIYFDVER